MDDSRDDKSILLQFAKFSKGFRISDFDEFIQECIGVENLDFFGRMAYPNQWQLRLTDLEIRERLIRTGRTRINKRSCWIYPLNQQEIRGFIYWLPNSITNERLKELLQQYGNVLLVESQERTIKGQKIESDPRYYGLILPFGTIKEDLPHFLKINGFLCLMIVRGREPACFHCKEIGHRRIECSKYKEKLTGYCNREPNTAPPRLRPRGRRHIRTKTGVQAETSENEVSFTQGIASLDQEIPVPESINESNLSSSEERDYVTEAQGEAKTSNEKELEESYILAQENSTDVSTASFSENQTGDIFETIQQIQRRTLEDLQQTLQNFGKEIALTFTTRTISTCTGDPRQSTATEFGRKSIDQDMGNEEVNMNTSKESVPGEIDENYSSEDTRIRETEDPETLAEFRSSKVKDDTANEITNKNLDQDMGNEELKMQTKKIYTPEESTPVKMDGNVSNVDTDKQETEGSETLADFSTSQVEEGTSESAQSVESNAEYFTSNADMNSVILMLKETKQAASEASANTFKALIEFAKSRKPPEKSGKDSSIDKGFKLTEDDSQELLAGLEETKAIATVDVAEALKKLETHLTTQLSGEGISAKEKLNVDDVHFSKQILEETNTTCNEMIKNTFKKLKEDVIKAAEKSQVVIERVDEKPLPQPANIIAQHKTTLKELKPEADTVKYVPKEGIEIVLQPEGSENASKSFEQAKVDPVTDVHGDFEKTEIHEHSEEIEKVATTEGTFSVSKEIEANVSKAVQQTIDKLETNIKDIFDLVQTRTGLLPETRTILKQVEAKVIKELQNTKSEQKAKF